MGVLERTLGREAAYLPEGGGEEFIQRLKAAVRRVNKNKADRFSGIFPAYQKERANKRLKQKPSGCHTRW